MLVPLSFVVLISMIKDIFEDVKRHKTDKLENNRIVHIGDPDTQKFIKNKWKELQVGRIVKIYQD